MNVIIAYLETMFSPFPSTPRLHDAKNELQTMMEDAYTGYVATGLSENEAVGRVITEFGNLDELAPVLGISAEIAPAPRDGNGPEAGDASAVRPARTPYPALTLDEAQRFADARRTTQPRIATAVALFTISPVPLLIGAMLAGGDRGDGRGDGDGLTGLGLIPLLALIALGVILIIGADQKRAPYKHIAAYRFSRTPAVTAWASELERGHERRRRISLQIAVALWILAATPILLTSLAFPDLGGTGNGALVGVIGTLCFVAFGLLVFLPNNWASEVAEILTKQHGSLGDDEDEDDSTSLFGVIAAFYWPLLTAVFLAWSFIGDAWDRSWIVWPIGAVLFGAIAAGVGAWESYRKNRR